MEKIKSFHYQFIYISSHTARLLAGFSTSVLEEKAAWSPLMSYVLFLPTKTKTSLKIWTTEAKRPRPEENNVNYTNWTTNHKLPPNNAQCAFFCQNGKYQICSKLREMARKSVENNFWIFYPPPLKKWYLNYFVNKKNKKSCSKLPEIGYLKKIVKNEKNQSWSKLLNCF